VNTVLNTQHSAPNTLKEITYFYKPANPRVMQIEDFIQSLEKEFEDIQPGVIKGETEFRKLEGWSSMMALIIIAKIDVDYNVTINAEELAQCVTINDLFELVHAKAA